MEGIPEKKRNTQVIPLYSFLVSGELHLRDQDENNRDATTTVNMENFKAGTDEIFFIFKAGSVWTMQSIYVHHLITEECNFKRIKSPGFPSDAFTIILLLNLNFQNFLNSDMLP